MCIDFFSGRRNLSHTGCKDTLGHPKGHLFFLPLVMSKCAFLTHMAYNDIMCLYALSALGHPPFVSHHVYQQLAGGSWIRGKLSSLVQTIYTSHFLICKVKEINLLLCEVQVHLKVSYENPNIYEMVSLVPGYYYYYSSCLLSF